MVPPQTVNYAPGVRKISRLIHENVNMKSRAVKLIVQILNAMNDKLVNYCRQETSGEEMTLPVAESAVKAICRGQTRNHALAEGHKTVFKYTCGVLAYESMTPTKMRQQKERLLARDLGSEHVKGVLNLLKLIYPEAKLHDKAKQLICRILGSLSRELSEKAKSSASRKITVTDIKRAVESLMPNEIRKHAISEGTKMVFLLESGSITFTPPSKKAPPRRKKHPPKPKVKATPPPPEPAKVSPKTSRRRRKERTPIKEVRTKRRHVKRKITAVKRRRPRVSRKRVVSKAKPKIRRKRKSVSRKRKVAEERPIVKRKRRVSRKRKAREIEEPSPKRRKVRRISRRPSPKRRELIGAPPTKKRKITKLKAPPTKRRKPSKKRKPSPRRRIVTKKARPRKKRAVAKKTIPRKKRRVVSIDKEPSLKRKRRVSRKRPSPAKKRKISRRVKHRKPSPKRPKMLKKAVTYTKATGEKPRGPVSSAVFKNAILTLNKSLNQSMDSSAVDALAINLLILAMSMVHEIKTDKSPTVGATQIRRAALKIFPEKLRGCAIARISQVASLT